MTTVPDAAYPVRLQPIRNRGGLILGAIIMLVLLTAMTAFAAYMVVMQSQIVRSAYVKLLFLSAGVIGDVMLVRFIVKTLASRRLPDPLVEVDRETVRRGESIAIHVRQDGPARFDMFQVSIACDVYDNGRIERQKPKFCHKHSGALVVDGQTPFTLKTKATIPADGSFSSPNTATWKIVVGRARPEVAALDREYVFRVE